MRLFPLLPFKDKTVIKEGPSPQKRRGLYAMNSYPKPYIRGCAYRKKYPKLLKETQASPQNSAMSDSKCVGKEPSPSLWLCLLNSAAPPPCCGCVYLILPPLTLSPSASSYSKKTSNLKSSHRRCMHDASFYCTRVIPPVQPSLVAALILPSRGFVVMTPPRRAEGNRASGAGDMRRMETTMHASQAYIFSSLPRGILHTFVSRV